MIETNDKAPPMSGSNNCPPSSHDDDQPSMEDQDKHNTDASSSEGVAASTAPVPSFKFTAPKELCREHRAFVRKTSTSSRHDNNFLRGCLWSPDGSCILTRCEDRRLRAFTLPDNLFSQMPTGSDVLTPISSMDAGEQIYDFAWYTGMSCYDPNSCLCGACSKDHPAHMWNVLTGQVVATFRVQNHLEELDAARSLAFTSDGSRLICGHKKQITIFNVEGEREMQSIHTTTEHMQRGIISCLAGSFSSPFTFAAGSFNKSLCVYDLRCPTNPMGVSIMDMTSGVTHLLWANDGASIYSGGRKDPNIMCWDMRFPGQTLYRIERRVDTNQRIYFDLSSDGKSLVSGSTDGSILTFDLTGGGQPVNALSDPQILPSSVLRNAHQSCVNGVSLNPLLPYLISSSGQRRFPCPLEATTSDSDSETTAGNNGGEAPSILPPGFSGTQEMMSEVGESELGYVRNRAVPLDNSLKLWHCV